MKALALLLSLASISAMAETKYSIAMRSCIEASIRVAGGVTDKETVGDAMKSCEGAFHVELMENNGALSEMQKSPKKLGCRVGAYWIIKGNNKDITDKKMLDAIVASKCK